MAACPSVAFLAPLRCLLLDCFLQQTQTQEEAEEKALVKALAAGQVGVEAGKKKGLSWWLK
jgi:hypothetical protein